MNVKIKENSRIAKWAARRLGTRSMALTLGHTIHLHQATRQTFLQDHDWVCHELQHVTQFHRYGFLRFLVLYLWESIRRGYYNNRFEAEARAAAKNRQLLEGVSFN